MSRSPGRSDEGSLSVKEKAHEAVEYLEKGPQNIKGLSEEERAWLASVDQKEASRIYHKVDVRLVPMLALLYLIAHLDRVSADLGSANRTNANAE